MAELVPACQGSFSHPKEGWCGGVRSGSDDDLYTLKPKDLTTMKLVGAEKGEK